MFISITSLVPTIDPKTARYIPVESQGYIINTDHIVRIVESTFTADDKAGEKIPCYRLELDTGRTIDMSIAKGNHLIGELNVNILQ